MISLSSSCSRLLALSASTLCPFLTPLKACCYETGFYYDFVTSQKSVDDSLLPLITVQMKRFRRENLKFELMTMMPKNAQSYLQSLGLPLQAALLDDVEGNLVQLCKVGKFCDICQDEVVPQTTDIPEFALYELAVFESEVPSLGYVFIVRIKGVCLQDKPQLKRLLKQIELAKKNDPIRLSQELDFAIFQESQAYFLPKMEASMQALEDAWRKECLSFGYQFIRVSKQDLDLMPVYEHFRKKKAKLPLRFARIVEHFAENDSQGYDLFFDPQAKRSFRCSLFCFEGSKDDEITSLLQFMKKLTVLLPFELSLVEAAGKNKPKRLYATDLRGRSWPLSEMTCTKRGEVVCIELSFLLSVERVFALLLERFGGKMPLWLAPEQVRVVCISPSAKEWALIVKERLEQELARTRLYEQDLGQAIYQADKDLVPICCIVGEKEQKNKTVNLRVCVQGQKRADTREVSLDSFIASFKECCFTHTWYETEKI
jgi:threonyl-tRNA synthetase